MIYRRIFLAFLFFLVAVPAFCQAGGNLYLAPASAVKKVGDTFSVAVKISADVKVNASDGALSFDNNLLTITGVSKAGSVFSLWTTEPAYNNANGRIEFGGGSPAGYSGSGGTIFTITFKAKVNGVAKVNFLSGSVLAADGKGSNVLSSMSGGAYTIEPKTVVPPAEKGDKPVVIPDNSPNAPIVSSKTHPDEGKWYSNNSPEFSWGVPKDVTAVQLLVNDSPWSEPTISYAPPISEKKVDPLADGVAYFHVRFKNQSGWGEITHRKILIDTKAPSPFKVEVNNEGEPANPTPLVSFRATDDGGSGIAYYEIKIGEGEAIKVAPEQLGTDPFRLPVQQPGNYTIIVKAVDFADNATVATAEMIIGPLDPPIITDLPKAPQPEDILAVKGTSKYPEAEITVYVKKEGEEPISAVVKADSEGKWSFVYEKSLEKGVYQIWAELKDKRGAKSGQSEKINLAVKLPSMIRIGNIIIDFLTVVLLLIGLIALLALIIGFLVIKIIKWRGELKKETKEAAKSVVEAFESLRAGVAKQIELLDGKEGLSRTESLINSRLKKAIDAAESKIEKEINDVKKDLGMK